jgi:O-antigen/teichoic acid export membrane protein
VTTLTSSRRLARNALLNLLGQGAPLIAAVVAIPLLIHGLGEASFGILTLAWAAIGYFTLFDFGLGRALTHAVATRVGAGDDDLSAVSWTALVLMALLGVLGSLVLLAAAPVLAHRVLQIPQELREESRVSFQLLALSVPAMIMTAGLRGIMEAHQDFGLATMLRLPLALFTFLGPLAVLPFSRRLVPVVAVLVLGRILTWVAHLLICFRRYEFLRSRGSFRAALVRPLVRFGGWMTISNVVSPMMVSMDRFLIGAILPIVAVAHYVTPYEVVTKILLVPQAVLGVLFPAFAAAFVQDRRRAAVLFERGLRTTALLTAPVLLILTTFAREGLGLWVGAEFARASTLVLQLLAIGTFVNGAVGQPAFTLMQGAGRPDLTAKLHLVELPLYAAGIWALARGFGLAGVALAWTLRVSFDAAVLSYLAGKAVPVSRAEVRRAVLLIVVPLLAFAASTALETLETKILFAVVMLAVFLGGGWFFGLSARERESLVAWARARDRVTTPTVLGAD